MIPVSTWYLSAPVNPVPILLNEAYDPKRLDEQLRKQTKAFLEDPTRNKIAGDKAQLSMIFQVVWNGF